MRPSVLIVAAIIIYTSAQAFAQTTLYKAVCKDSSFKDADANSDLAAVQGVPITCAGVTISKLANKRLSVQFVIPGQSVLGFGGDEPDLRSNLKFMTLPLKRIYLPGKGNSDVPLTVEGIEGECLLDGKSMLALTGIICIAKLESGSRRQIYEIQSQLVGGGQTIPLSSASPKK